MMRPSVVEALPHVLMFHVVNLMTCFRWQNTKISDKHSDFYHSAIICGSILQLCYEWFYKKH